MLGSYFQVIDTSATNNLAAFQHFPFQIISGKVTEEILVVHLDLTFRQIAGGCPDILVIIPHLVHMRVRNTIRADQAVIAEVIIASVELIEIAAISIDHFPVLAGPAHGLIHEVPDEAPLIFRVFTDQIPIFLETSLRVTHGMSVFTLYQRLLHGVILAVFSAILVVVIHRAEDIGLSVLSGLFVLYGTAGVFVLDPVVSGLEVRTVSSLVTQGPEDDTRMVEATLDVTLVTFQMRFLIRWVLG